MRVCLCACVCVCIRVCLADVRPEGLRLRELKSKYGHVPAEQLSTCSDFYQDLLQCVRGG